MSQQEGEDYDVPSRVVDINIDVVGLYRMPVILEHDCNQQTTSVSCRSYSGKLYSIPVDVEAIAPNMYKGTHWECVCDVTQTETGTSIMGVIFASITPPKDIPAVIKAIELTLDPRVRSFFV